jgi:glycosyltransferase involved in cell wall biosynthesis
MKISVITVCRNNLTGLMITAESIKMQNGDFEWIVIDGGSSDGTREYLAKLEYLSKWVSEPDNGIYDAMNKGLDLAEGGAVIFLNGGDYFVGDVLSKIEKAPGLILVKTESMGVPYFLRRKSFKMGMPYCHQGIVFENTGVRYKSKYRIAGDYDFYLRHGYRNINFLIKRADAYVVYDNRGLSARSFVLRDREISQIIRENFGLFHVLVFQLWAFVKLVIKRFFELFP